MEVSFGGDTQETSVANIGSQGFSGWMKESMNFTATVASEVLQFVSIGTPTGSTPVALLDGVSLTGGVPEPGTWAILGLGFASRGVVAYRRRRKALAIG